MDARTLEALKGSIEKWERVVTGEYEERMTADCPLCHLFADDECNYCPIKQTTKNRFCLNTPYRSWKVSMARRKSRTSRVANTPHRKALAQAELDFLRTLLPKED